MRWSHRVSHSTRAFDGNDRQASAHMHPHRFRRVAGICGCAQAQCRSVRSRWIAPGDRDAGDGADVRRNRDKGVNFINTHSLFPTFTMPNSSGMATGHYLGDTGVFGNVLYAGFPIRTAASARLSFIETMASSATSTTISPVTSSTKKPSFTSRIARATTPRQSARSVLRSSSIIPRAMVTRASSSTTRPGRPSAFRSRLG